MTARSPRDSSKGWSLQGGVQAAAFDSNDSNDSKVALLTTSHQHRTMAGLVALALLPLAAYGAAFPPVSTNCTEAASKAASWTVRGFTFDTDTRFDYGVGTAGKASFSILNSANGYDFKCVQGDGGN